MDMKKQVADRVQEIGDLNAQMDDHWLEAQKCIADGRVDDAIPRLKAYFRLKEKLANAETQLEGTLKGYFSGRN
jgi:hypothetical protein